MSITRKNVRALTSIDAAENLSVTGTLNIRASSSFVVPTISTSSEGYYSLNTAIHSIDQSLQEANAKIVSSVGNLLGQYNASRYVFSGYLDSSGNESINLTTGAPSGSTYYTADQVSNLSVNILTDPNGDGIFTNNLLPYKLRPNNGQLFLDITAPGGANIMYRVTVSNDKAIVNLPVSNGSYLTEIGVVGTINAETVLADNTKLYNTAITNIYVSPTGSDSNDGLTLTSSFATIQKAVDSISYINNSAKTRLQYHAVINIASGTYNEKVNIFNKSYGGNKSNLLMLIKGDREYVYQNLTGIANVSTDPDSGDSTGFPGVTLNFTGALPAVDSLKGYFLVSGTGSSSTGIPITSNSGSTIYYSTTTNYSGSSISIYRLASKINGYFRCIGNEGAIVFKEIDLNLTTNDAGGNTTFGLTGFGATVGTIDEGYSNVVSGTSVNVTYPSYGKDIVRANSCRITRPSGAGTTFYLGPKTTYSACFLSSSNDATLNITALDSPEFFLFNSSYCENIAFNFSQVNNVNFAVSYAKNCLFTFNSCLNAIGPRKHINTGAVGYQYYINDTTFNISNNTYYKSIGFNIDKASAVLLNANVTSHGPWSRHFFVNNLSTFTAINNGNFKMSGSVQGDFLFYLYAKSVADFSSYVNVSNVASAIAANPHFAVRNSTISFNTALPTVAASGSALYKSIGDIRLDTANYFFSELPIINQEGSKANYEQNAGNAKSKFNYPFEMNNNMTVSSSYTLDLTKFKINASSVLPAGTLGLMAVSGTHLYFHNGTTWNQIG